MAVETGPGHGGCCSSSALVAGNVHVSAAAAGQSAPMQIEQLPTPVYGKDSVGSATAASSALSALQALYPHAIDFLRRTAESTASSARLCVGDRRRAVK